LSLTKEYSCISVYGKVQGYWVVYPLFMHYYRMNKYPLSENLQKATHIEWSDWIGPYRNPADPGLCGLHGRWTVQHNKAGELLRVESLRSLFGMP